MTGMTREELKRSCLERLEQVAQEHPAGHQGKLATRYVLVTDGGSRIGLMFEKAPNTRAYLWVPRRFGHVLEEGEIETRVYPAAALHQVVAEGDKRRYGRHSGLKPMRDLANVDLVRFDIVTVGQIENILYKLKHSQV